ncbi:tRNA 2-thiouridine(34) synthase MnmA, partial [Candidatus Collierbacteria bacterium CG10_big_fil_rev_8_21_14_0_10_43_36]
EVGKINWIGGVTGLDDMLVRIRHGGEMLEARTQEIKNSRNQVDGMFVLLDKPVRGIAPGQSAIFYSHEGECLGGGVIH